MNELSVRVVDDELVDLREKPVPRRLRVEAPTDARWPMPVDDPSLDIAVLIPCRNEESTIGKVVRDFSEALPGATIYVYDNASTDRTGEVAAAAGAVWRRVHQPGKGHVLRRMFAEVEATVYVLADGDDTYEATSAPAMVNRLCLHHLDMVVGMRVEAQDATKAYRRGHKAGNRFLTRSVRWLFGDGSQDMLSGYRVFSRRYVKSFPAHSCGFETETEMTVHALDLRLPFEELPTEYRERPEESTSKLRTIPDGIRILTFIMMLCKDYRPLLFFGTLSFLCGCFAVVTANMARGYLHAWTPQTFATVAFGALALVFGHTAVVLNSLGRTRKEMKRVLYLAVQPRGRAQDGPALAFSENTEPQL